MENEEVMAQNAEEATQDEEVMDEGTEKSPTDERNAEKFGKVQFAEIDKLKPHPKNEEIYGEEDVSDLIAQIEACGEIIDPLKIKEDGTIISGHRRWKAAKELGLTEVPCQIVSYESPEEELVALVMFNHKRTKTNEQKAREGMTLEENLKSKGMQRKLKTLKQNQTDGDTVSQSENADSSSTTPESGGTDEEEKKGRTRDIVAETVKISSGRCYDRMKKVIETVDKLRKEGKSDDADFLVQLMNGSVKPAYDLVEADRTSLTPEERKSIEEKKVSVKNFLGNNTNSAKPKQLAAKQLAERIEKKLNDAKQMLTDIVAATDSLDEEEAKKLLGTISSIREVMEKAEEKFKSSDTNTSKEQPTE